MKKICKSKKIHETKKICTPKKISKPFKRLFIEALFIAMFIIMNLSIGVKAEEVSSKVYFLNESGQINESLFKDDEYLCPGSNMVKEFYIVNNNDFTCSIKSLKVGGNLIQGSGADKNRVFSDSLHLQISAEKDGIKYLNENGKLSNSGYREFMDNVHIKFYAENIELFNGSAEDFLKVDIKPENLDIKGRDKIKLVMELSMKEMTNNEAMDKVYMFNILTNLIGENAKIQSSESGNLTQTGGIINTRYMMIAGGILIIVGFILFLNKRLGR